ESSWTAIRAGGQAVRWLNMQESPVRWAGAPAPDALEFQLSDFTAQISEPVVSLALLAAKEAILDAGLRPAADNDQRSQIADQCGCVIGTSKLGLRSFARAMRTQFVESASDASDWRLLWPDAAVRIVADALGLRSVVVSGRGLCDRI